jgi:D-alanyl-D-alanine dipeptidase
VIALPRFPALALVAVLVSQAPAQTPVWPREPERPAAPKPPAATADQRALVGAYGTDANPVWVLEQDGALFAIAGRGVWTPVTASAFSIDAAGRGTAVRLGTTDHPRRQLGPAEGTSQLRVTPVAPVAELLREARKAAPPEETGDFLPPDLIELVTLDPSIHLEIRYATTNNFLGAVFYAAPRAFMQRPAAEAVARAAAALKPLGYGLLIHDGYRPWFVTKTFWDATPAEKKWLVADPSKGSKHNRGAAVDLTLYELSTGRVVEMPSTYDESTARAYAFFPGGTSLQRWHRALLRRVMESEGFTVNPEEWWHFDYKDWQRYRIGNIAFDAIRVTRASR